MPQIVETIVIGKLAYQFLFHKVVTAAALKFFVSVRLEGKQVTAFEIKKGPERWELLHPVKPSILAMKEKLIEIADGYAKQQRVNMNQMLVK